MGPWPRPIAKLGIISRVLEIGGRERFVQFVQLGSQTHGERGARTYNRGLGAVPSVGKPLVRGLSVKPPEADEILANKIPMHADFASNSVHTGKKNVNTNYSPKINTSLCIITQ